MKKLMALSAAILMIAMIACTASPTSTPVPTPTSPGATPAAATPTADVRPLKIGLVDGLTGSVAQQCALLRDGAQIAVDEINATGGINGRKVELIVRDDALDPAKTTALAKQLREGDKVNILIGANASTSAISLAKYADDNKVPAVGGQPAAEDLNNYKYYFRAFTTNSEFAKGLLLIAKNLGITKVGVAYINLAWGIDLNRMIAQYAADYGITVVGSEGIESGATDAMIPAKKLKDAGAMAILNPDYASGVLAFAQARKALGWEVPMIEIETTFGPALRAADPAIYEGYNVLSFQDSANPRVIAVWDAYEKKYGKRLDDSNILGGYDCAMVAMLGLKNATNPDDPEAVRTALEKLTGYAQVRGRMNQSSSFSPTQHYLISATDMVHAVVTGGKIVSK